MKLNKFFLPLFVSSFFLSNTCLGIEEGDHNQVSEIPKRTNDNQEVTEHLVRPKPEMSSEILEAIKKSKTQENKPSNNETNNEANNSPSRQTIEAQPEKPKVSKPKKSIKKKEEKKVEVVQTQEQNTNQHNESPQENNDSIENKPLPEVSYDEVEKFKNRIPTSNQKDGKEYIIRGLVSMMLVVAGAILLVIVIITSVGNKKGKYGKKRNRNYYDDKF